MPSDDRSRPTLPWLVPATVITVAAVLVAGVLTLGRGGSESSDSPVRVHDAEQPSLTGAETRDEDDPLSAGPVDAPVVLVVFSDYQCPFCARWSEDTLPAMMRHAEAGDLRIEWRDVNVFGPASERAARAAYAAGRQGRFWQYHDALFADGERRTERQLTDGALIALARDLRLDAQRFRSDLAARDTARAVADHQRRGMELGATSTPVFVMGGRPIVGAQPTEVFEDAFRSALENQR